MCRRSNAGIVVNEVRNPVHTLTGGGGWWWWRWVRWNSRGRLDPNALA